MKWPSWFPRLLTEPAPGAQETSRTTRFATPPGERLGIREVGQCEACGRLMQARTRRQEFRGRVDCDCGFRNHVEFREVRANGTIEKRHVTVSAGRRFEFATHKPDLRLAWRHGICSCCSTAVRLLDACVLTQEDPTGSLETISYYCDACHVDDDLRRGRLTGHDGSHVVDTLHFQLRTGVR